MSLSQSMSLDLLDVLAVTLRPLGYSHHNNPPVSAAASEGASSSANVGAIAERMHRAISSEQTLFLIVVAHDDARAG